MSGIEYERDERGNVTGFRGSQRPGVTQAFWIGFASCIVIEGLFVAGGLALYYVLSWWRP